MRRLNQARDLNLVTMNRSGNSHDHRGHGSLTSGQDTRACRPGLMSRHKPKGTFPADDRLGHFSGFGETGDGSGRSACRRKDEDANWRLRLLTGHEEVAIGRRADHRRVSDRATSP
jgi:hypothetical protein